MIRSLKILSANCTRRCNSALATNVKENVSSDKMQAWQVHSYDGIEKLQLNHVKMPIISKKNHVLVQVEAASVNPIDVAMINGYGATAINVWRKTRQLETGTNLFDPTIEFPLTMGRDFAGTVVAKGHGVDSRLRIGDKVWGVVPIKEQGCHASHVVVDSSLVFLKPENVTAVEAASIPYAGLTAWSSLWITGGICYKTLLRNTRMNKPVLVLGGSGGVGTLAIQLLKAWNFKVVATGRNDAIDMLEQLGADLVVDYQEKDADAVIKAEGPYDIILDCCNQGVDTIKSKGYPFTTFITLNSPLLKNIDAHGLVAGNVRNLAELIKQNVPNINASSVSTVKWGFFMPCESGMQTLQELVETEKMKAVVNSVYPFSELPNAYKHVSEGHLRGKIVIDMK